MKKIILLFILFITFSNLYAQVWTKVGTGKNTFTGTFYVNSIQVDALGNIYVAGAFTNANGKYYVAKWNGTAWTEFGFLNANDIINVIQLDGNGNVYAAGAFTNASGKRYVAKWNGTVWSELGTGTNALNLNGQIRSIAIDKSENIYACGDFQDANFNGIISKWNGTNWTQMGTGVNGLDANNGLTYITVDDLYNVYASIEYVTNNGGSNVVITWNGTKWVTVGSGNNALLASGSIYTIVSDASGNLYASGGFTDSFNKNSVCKWDGTTWSILGAGLNALNANNEIRTIIRDKKTGYIYAAGTFTNASGYTYVAKWNGTTWSTFGSDLAYLLNSDITTLALDAGSNLYAAGYMYNDDANGYTHVVKCGTNALTTSTTSALDQKQIHIYPNPSTGVLHFLDLSENVTLTIYNVLGESVFNSQISFPSSNVDLSNLKTGSYSIVLNGQNYTYVQIKWIKE